MALSFDTLAARAINATRPAHKPSYAGLRLLVESLSTSHRILKSFLDSRSQSRASWRYYGYQIVKDAGSPGHITYRNCICGSPLTTLAEAHILGLMSSQPTFRLPDTVYSYRWPTELRSGRNFEYYFDGYSRRTDRINESLSRFPNYVAVITDVKRFYPSVNLETLRETLLRRLNSISDDAIRRSIESFVFGILSLESPKSTGIPIGPDISHALGNIALAPVDHAMEAYGPAYFRYVDDIVVVCPSSEASAALATLRSKLDALGLSLNEDKTDTVDAQTWFEESAAGSSPGSGPTFESLVRGILDYLIWRPGKADELEQQLRDAGFSLPVSRFRSMAKSKRFRGYYLRRRLRMGSVFSWLGALATRSDHFVSQARAVRDHLWDCAQNLTGRPMPESPVRRRWLVQKQRYLLNRLLYLLPPSSYRQMLSIAPSVPEFNEFRVVASALSTGDFTEAVRYPGRVVTTICEIWAEQFGSLQPRVDWPVRPERPEAEAATHLALYLSLAPPTSFMQALDQRTPGARILVEICAGLRTDPTRVEPLSYLHEMREVFGQVSASEIRRMMTSRFDEREDLGLDALWLGGPDYQAVTGRSDYSD